MNCPQSSFSVNVDVKNPGQFFACCGLLELAHRLWPGAEAKFDLSEGVFAMRSDDSAATLAQLLSKLCECGIMGLTKRQLQERDDLEAERRLLKKENRELTDEKEARRKELGALARAGPLTLQSPFNLVLDWWRTRENGATTPKTWAGRQELHKVARAAQDALGTVGEPTNLLDHGCVLRIPEEYQKRSSDRAKPVEPFYFDARRFTHALDVGFSLDVQDAETVAFPATELLALIGIQRFRPRASPEGWSFGYAVWSRPLATPVAGAVANSSARASLQREYRFRLLPRDDQLRYKAFSFATPIGEES